MRRHTTGTVRSKTAFNSDPQVGRGTGLESHTSDSGVGDRQPETRGRGTGGGGGGWVRFPSTPPHATCPRLSVVCGGGMGSFLLPPTHRPHTTLPGVGSPILGQTCALTTDGTGHVKTTEQGVCCRQVAYYSPTLVRSRCDCETHTFAV